jgi:DNA polymerase
LLGEVGLRREDVYIANVLKCRPPNNRDPARDEVDSCKDYLRAQISMIDPRVVVTLGNFATKLLMRTETGITRLRGRTYPWWQGRTLVPTYHPAAALRSGDRLIGEMQSDFSLVRDALSKPRSNTVNSLSSGKGASPESSTDSQPDVPSDGSRPDSKDQAEQMNLFA